MIGWILGGVAILASAITFRGGWPGAPEPTPLPRPLTAYEGVEHQPSFSPDARHIAFVWDAGKGQDLHIYLRRLDGGNPVHLTHGAGLDIDPTWSPDGNRIAFVRFSGEESVDVFVVPSTGGPEVQVTRLRNRRPPKVSSPSLPALITWTPDGDGLVVSDMDESGRRSGLFLVPLSGGPRRRLTAPEEGWHDIAPAFSPNRQSIAFVRTLSILDADVFVLTLDASQIPVGAPRRLSSLRRMTSGLTWTRDSRDIIFASGQPGASRLWRVSAQRGGDARPLPFAQENVLWPAISSQGHLAYEVSRSDTNIWRAPLRTAGEPQRLIASTRDDDVPEYSPDGRRIVFLSKRDGSNEIWIADADGSSASQVTHLRARFIGWPHWSPDGSSIVFDSPHDQRIDVFSISAAGGSPRALTAGNSPCGAASYSRSGRWIYYHCIEAGTPQIWRMPAGGGTPEKVGSGMAQLEAPDGRYLYFVRQTAAGVRPLWRQQTVGGEAVQVLPDVDPFHYAVTPDGVYFGSGPDERGICFIRFLHAASGKISTVLNYSGRPSPGMSVSPDGKWLLYSYDEQRNADLLIVENFH
jgi:Tol biopolymer transport system component